MTRSGPWLPLEKLEFVRELGVLCGVSLFPTGGLEARGYRGAETRDSHPDHVDADQHVDGFVAGDALEHAMGGVEASLPGHVFWERYFVHAEGALCVRGVLVRVLGSRLG